VRRLLVTGSVVPSSESRHSDEGGANFLRNYGYCKSHTAYIPEDAILAIDKYVYRRNYCYQQCSVGSEWSASCFCRFYPRRYTRQYSLDRKLDGAHSPSGRHGEVTALDPTGTRSLCYKPEGLGFEAVEVIEFLPFI
jgi:hypothetical protein